MRALDCLDLAWGSGLSIADVGCGSGAQTLTLAERTGGRITAVDLFPEFLGKLRSEAERRGLGARIETLEANMEALPFERGSLDLIWSEGAVYNMGFEAGVKAWREFLKPGGYMALSELSWFRSRRPAELEAHWLGEYPEIGTAYEKIAVLERHGFELRGYFQLPVTSWTEEYYGPMEARFEAFLERHGQSEEARAIVEGEKAEMELFRKYSDYYGYGFYVGRRVDP